MASDDDMSIGVNVWADNTGKFLRFTITDLGASIQVEMLHEHEEKVDEQASAIIFMAHMLPAMMGGALRSAVEEWGVEE